jgi:hypothetical protein
MYVRLKLPRNALTLNEKTHRHRSRSTALQRALSKEGGRRGGEGEMARPIVVFRDGVAHHRATPDRLG